MRQCRKVVKMANDKVDKYRRYLVRWSRESGGEGGEGVAMVQQRRGRINILYDRLWEQMGSPSLVAG